MQVTQHAQVRSQQRGIPLSPFVIELLERFGRRQRIQGGAESLTFDRAARRQLREHLGARIYAKLEAYLDDVYIVVADGTALTAGHRNQRFRWH